MMKSSRIIKNASWIIACKVVQSVLAFVIGILTARYLGPSNYGLVNYAASVVAFVTPIMYLGFNSTLVRELVKDPEKEGEILGSAIGTSLISAVLCIIGVNAFVLLVNAGEHDTFIVCLLYSSLLLFQAVDLIQYWFQAKLLSKFTSLAMLGAYLVVSGYRIFLLVTQRSVFWFAMTSSLEYLLIAAALIVIYGKVGKGKLGFSASRTRDMLSRSWFFIISNMMITVFTQTDRIMLKLMMGDMATGLYSAAVSLCAITSFVFTAIIDTARPVVLESADNKEDFERNVRCTYFIVIVLSLLQCAAMTALARHVVMLTYGADYAGSIPVLRLVVWYTTFSYIGAVRSIWILAKNYQKYIWAVNLAGAAMNIILNFFAIPCWGMMGAAAASVFAQLFTNVLIGFIIKPFRPNNRLMFTSLDPEIAKSMISKLKH